jgi:hypothetical protein
MRNRCAFDEIRLALETPNAIRSLKNTPNPCQSIEIGDDARKSDGLALKIRRSRAIAEATFL